MRASAAAGEPRTLRVMSMTAELQEEMLRSDIAPSAFGTCLHLPVCLYACASLKI